MAESQEQQEQEGHKDIGAGAGPVDTDIVIGSE